MSRILVTGAGGFIGSRALEPLVAAGHEVHAVSRGERAPIAGVTWHRADLLHSAEVVAQVRAERLLHLAWDVEHGRFWTAPENLDWAQVSLALLRAFADAGGTRAVMAGTCAEYDWRAPAPFSELATPLRPATLYGTAKNDLHTAAAALARERGMSLAWGRVFLVYGPGEAPERLVASLARRMLAEEPAPMTAGTQLRDLLHVDDVAGAFAALVSGEARGAVNIGSGTGVSIREVAELVAAAAGHPELLRIGALEPREDEPAAIVADVTRLRDEVGFIPRIGLPDGIDATVASWRAA